MYIWSYQQQYNYLTGAVKVAVFDPFWLACDEVAPSPLPLKIRQSFQRLQLMTQRISLFEKLLEEVHSKEGWISFQTQKCVHRLYFVLWFHCWSHHQSALRESCFWIDREYHCLGRWHNSLGVGESPCLCLMWLRPVGDLLHLGQPTACCSQRGQSIAVHPQLFGPDGFLRHWEAWICPIRGKAGSCCHTWLRGICGGIVAACVALDGSVLRVNF